MTSHSGRRAAAYSAAIGNITVASMTACMESLEPGRAGMRLELPILAPGKAKPYPWTWEVFTL